MALALRLIRRAYIWLVGVWLALNWPQIFQGALILFISGVLLHVFGVGEP